jgi:predicted ester cyclase
MSTITTKTLAQRYFTYLDRQDLAGLRTMFAPTLKFHGLAPQTLDREGVVGAMAMFFASFPDARMPAHEIIVEGNSAAIRHAFIGTHQAAFQGIPPTNTPVTVAANLTLHFDAEGQVCEGWLNADLLGLLQQLGTMPAGEPEGL